MNLTITSDTNIIKVSITSGDPFGTWRKDAVLAFVYTGDRIKVETQGEIFEVANTTTTGCYVIDTVNGSAPSSLTDLYNKLIALL